MLHFSLRQLSRVIEFTLHLSRVEVARPSRTANLLSERVPQSYSRDKRYYSIALFGSTGNKLFSV